MPAHLSRRAAGFTRPSVDLLLLYAFGLAVNVTFGLLAHYRGGPSGLEFDEREYYDLASGLLAGDMPMLGRRTLGFPLMIAAIRSVTDNFYVLQIVVTAIYAASTPLLFVLARRLGAAPSWAWLPALAFTLWPPATYYGTSLYSETAALPFFLAALALLPKGLRLPGALPGWGLKAALIAGIVLGLTTHVRPMYLLFLPFLALTLWLEDGRFRVASARFVVALLGFLIVILPWSGYVSSRLGSFVLVTANGGETLAGAMTPKLLETQSTLQLASHATWVGPGKWLPINANGYLSPAEQQLPYARKDGLMRERAIAWARAHPSQAAYLELAKFTYMWGVWPIERNDPLQILFGNVPTILLVLAALALAARRPRTALAFARVWIVPLFVTGVAMVSWGSWRFRQPGDAALIVFVLLMAERAWEERSVTRAVRLAAL